MALQAWLPLNGDIKNYGASNAIITNNGATVNSAGKIGSCYRFDSNTIVLNSIDVGDEFSVCYWVKYVDLSYPRTHVGIKHSNGAYTGSNKGWDIAHGPSGGGTYNFDINDGSNIQRISFSASNLTELNVWKHFALVCSLSNRKVKLYINGVLESEENISASIGSFKTDRDLSIGGLYGWYLNGYLNDFRIYNHCLSYEEVKEISKALVVHYPLNKPNIQRMDNCFSYPTFDTSNGSGGWSHWGQSGSSGSYSQNTDKKYIYPGFSNYSHCFSNASGATGHYLLYQSPSFSGGYRSLCAIIKESNGLPITDSICHPDWNANTSSTKGTPFKWTSIMPLSDGFYLCKREGINQDGSNNLVGLYCHPGYTVYVTCAYLENGKECCSDIFDQNTTKVSDCSGFKHDGTVVIGNGLMNDDSARNLYSTKFSNLKIDSSFSTYGLSNLTYAVWIKPFARTSDRSCISIGGTYITIDNEGHLAGYAYGKSNEGYHTGSTVIPLNQWTHIAIVWDDSYIYGYVNGTLDFKVACTGTFSGSTQQLGIEGSSSRIYSGLMSDFRIYATALSADDISKEYYNFASIYNNGSLSAYDFSEV